MRKIQYLNCSVWSELLLSLIWSCDGYGHQRNKLKDLILRNRKYMTCKVGIKISVNTTTGYRVFMWLANVAKTPILEEQVHLLASFFIVFYTHIHSGHALLKWLREKYLLMWLCTELQDWHRHLLFFVNFYISNRWVIVLDFLPCLTNLSQIGTANIDVPVPCGLD